MWLRTEIAALLTVVALVGFVSIGVQQGWAAPQIIGVGLALAVAVVVLNRWVRR
jgi:hypothetical protein